MTPSLTFGTMPVNVPSAPLTVTVTADGTNPLDPITNLAFTGPFSLSSATPSTCAAGTSATGSCTINVVFTPTLMGAATGTLTINATTGNGATPVTVTGSPVNLSGTGYEPSVAVQLMGKVVTLINQSSTPLNFTLSALPANFAITGGTCPTSGTITLSTLTSSSCTVNIAATSTAGNESAPLTVTATPDGTINVPVNGSPATIGEPPPGGPTGSGTDTGLEQAVSLTAQATTATLPDGMTVPMWGYSCGAPVPNSGATCARLNPNGAGWSPVVITVPSGQDLEINLTNNFSFANGNNIPTSLTIVGQLGGGIGTPGGFTNPPDHSKSQTVTWPIADPTTSGTPPTQGPAYSRSPPKWRLERR